jgi:hypothetical protein
MFMYFFTALGGFMMANKNAAKPVGKLENNESNVLLTGV